MIKVANDDIPVGRRGWRNVWFCRHHTDFGFLLAPYPFMGVGDPAGDTLRERPAHHVAPLIAVTIMGLEERLTLPFGSPLQQWTMANAELPFLGNA